MANTYVITAACIDVKDAACVDVCPVDCIFSNAAAPQFYINPVECIDCGSCVPVCPVQAIYQDSEVPLEQQAFIAINAEFFTDPTQTIEPNPPKWV